MISLRLLNVLAAALFVVALPFAVVLTNVRLMVFDAGYYLRGFERHSQTTGMTPEQFVEVTDQIQSYFRGGPAVSLVIQKEWGREPIFNAREQQHMVDVRDLLSLALRVQEVSLVYVLGAAAALLAFRRSRGAATLARWLSAGAGLTLVLFAALGLLAVGDFQSFWTQFHLLSFSNDLWMLDPRTDYLIRLTPPAFWFDAVLDLVVRSVVTAAVLLLVSQGSLRWGAGRRTIVSATSSGR